MSMYDHIELKMQSKMINQTLLNKWNGYSFGVTVARLADKVGEWDVGGAYFFLRKELEVTRDTWNAAKQRGEIRHCKIYRGKFLDYVVHKEFNTIEEWVTDAGGKMEDVLYGENRIRETTWKEGHDGVFHRVWKTAMYVELSVLLKALGYVEPPQIVIPEIVERNLTEILDQEMRKYGMCADHVYVLANGVFVPWKMFIKHDS